MKGTKPGEFEKIVLLTIAALYDDAYSVALLEEMVRRMERSISIGLVHQTIEPLNKKAGQLLFWRGYIRKRWSARALTLTPAGVRLHLDSRRLRNELRRAIAKEAFKISSHEARQAPQPPTEQNDYWHGWQLITYRKRC